MIFMNTNNTKNVISSSGTWERIYNRFSTTLSESLQSKIPDHGTINRVYRILPSSNGDCVMHHTIYSVLSCLQQPPVTFRAFPNEASFRAQPLNSRHQQQEEVSIRFPAGRYTLYITSAHQQESDLN